jgi:hypothetical protein
VLPKKNKQQVWDSVLSNAPVSTPDLECLRQLDVTHAMIVWFKSSNRLVLVKGERDSHTDCPPGRLRRALSDAPSRQAERRLRQGGVIASSRLAAR